ncbi:MDR family MFS transporter [Rhodotorula paludigena]|uniref:MDR family MFS transporter n=1 Tax=Rhodotorula paludigena TaxID=86838 RepID=UPI00317387FE
MKAETASSIASTPAASEPATDVKPKAGKRGARFWLVFLALIFCVFLSALDLTAVSTALPTIAQEFDSSEFSWVGSAYALTSTALIPWTGGLAAIFGRRPVMVAALALFALGSAITGAAQSMAMMIGGRSVQGIGGGAILTMTEIIVCDLVPLAERGAFFGIIGAVWALASAIGPPIGGALANAGAWRWLWYLNLPLTGIAFVLVMLFLDVKAPKLTTKEKLERMDYFNILFVASATAAILGLTWGGTAYPWSSFRVIVPLVLGFLGMVVFVVVERYVKHPTVPFAILVDRNSYVGFFTTFLHSLLVMAIVYYLPAFYQMRGDSAIEAGVKIFPLSFTIAPFAIIVGISVTITGHYVTQNIIGWAIIVLGFGLMNLIKTDSGRAVWASTTAVTGIGLGMLYAATNFPILSPIKPSQQPHAITFYGFVRSLGQVFGISIGATIFTNELTDSLPAAFAEQLGGHGGELAYAAIPVIQQIGEPLRREVQDAFTHSLRMIWIVCAALGGVGVLVSLLFKNIPLTTEMDEENWGLKDKEKKAGGAAGNEEEKVGSA